MKRLALFMAVVALALVAVAPAYGQSAATMRTQERAAEFSAR